MIRRWFHRISLAAAVLFALASLVLWTRVLDRNARLDEVLAVATDHGRIRDADSVAVAIGHEIFRRTNAGISPEAMSLLDRLEATSFFNVGTGVALKYGGYGVRGQGQYGPCGTMTRATLNALWRMGIPARKLQLLADSLGRGGGHTMLEFRTGDRWQVISPGDSGFVWRTHDGRIATVEEIRADSSVFGEIFAWRADYPYRFSNPWHIRWQKLPPWMRAGFRVALGEERYRAAETPRLYDQPRALLCYLSLIAIGLCLAAAWALRARGAPRAA